MKVVNLIQRMKLKVILPALAFLVLGMWSPCVCASDGEVVLAVSGNVVSLKVDGDRDDDWWLESSTNLTTWTTMTNFGTVLSGNETNAVWRAAGTLSNATTFYRARQTAGLYDTTMLRTISLTFTQSNWSNLLAVARNTTNYVYGTLLTMNNGATNTGFGARFRGNTSFTGMPTPPPKKSFSIAIDYATTNADLMGYNSLNLNNAYGDETIMREPVYFSIMRQYTVCPAACLAQLYVNGQNRGVYSQNQQQNNDLIREYFPSTTGDRWRAPNMDGSGAFIYLNNTNLATYTPHYELKSDYNTNAWPRLINAIYTFNTLATNTIRDTAEDVIAVDRWLWFLACENVFADDDSYWNKGSDYMLYYEPESGRFHPVEHDGNDAFFANDTSLSPVQGSTGTTRPIISRLLGNAELRQRYLAHMRTILAEYYNPAIMTPFINRFVGVSVAAITADPYKGYTTMSTYSNDLTALKTFVTNRYNYLNTHAELTPLQPNITSVIGPTNVFATNAPSVTAAVAANGTSGLSSVWLYHRGKPYGKFAKVQMFDDGAHQDGAAGDGVFGAATTNYAAGTKVRYYIEARGANAAQATRFSPARAEQETHSYRVGITTATNSPVVINEILASNTATLADPQGEYDDWIELRNLTSAVVDLGGRYLSDEPNNPRKWQFPFGTTIPADGYLLIWADEDTTDTPGLHASFKLSGSGESLYLADTDSRNNQILDAVVFGDQTTDVSYGRSSADADAWTTMTPTPGADNP